jgi:hypothetical protein
LWPESAVTLPVPHWNSFHAIWKRRCPKVKIRNICEDTCPECSSSSCSGGGSNKENYHDEELIAEATNHAEEAQQQQALAKARQQTATEEANSPHEDRRFVVIFSFEFIFAQVSSHFFFFSF